jgi:hypothetical protein
MRKDLEGSDHDLIKLLSENLPGGAEDNREKPREDSRCAGRDWNQPPPEYKSTVLVLHQLLGFMDTIIIH